MNIAIAQIDMRLGDIEAICARIESQAVLAHEQGAQLLCTPAPLFAGPHPTPLVDAANYVHDLLLGLQELSQRLAGLEMTALVPAFVSYEGSPVLEVFMLREGRTVPMRSLAAIRRGQMGEDDIWLPPVFDVDGVRCAVTFEAEGVSELLPPGCDLLVYFQIDPLDVASEQTSAVAAVADGHFRQEAVKRSVWLACVAPIGGYGDAVYAGGSFVMDDCGRVVAAAPCFEEALLVQDVQRGMALPCIEDYALPHFSRDEWLWEGLRIALADAALAQGSSRAVLVLDGDLPSSLAAALCVDAFGPRNVTGLFVARQQATTPAQEAAEHERAGRVRALADALHIRVVEREEPDLAAMLDRDMPPVRTKGEAESLACAGAYIAQLLLGDLARIEHAVPVSSLTKTDYALAPWGLPGSMPGEVAPFGDVYLTMLEFLARMRNSSGAALPPELASLRAVNAYRARITRRAAALEDERPVYAARIAEVLGSLEPSQIDSVLEAHIDRDCSFDDIPLSVSRPDAVGLLLMLVRRGEAARRTLPAVPMVSARSFAERGWPRDLAWSDLGRHGAEQLDLAGLVHEAVDYAESRGEELGARMRGEIMGLVGSMLGIDPAALEELASEEGRKRLGKRLPELEERLQRSLHEFFEGGGTEGQGGPSSVSGPGGHGFSFFSQN